MFEQASTFQLLDISINHLPHSDVLRLKEIAEEQLKDDLFGLNTIYQSCYGFIISCPLDEEITPEEIGGEAEAYRELGLSDQFVKIMKAAYQSEYDYIKFDRDGNCISDLETFEW